MRRQRTPRWHHFHSSSKALILKIQAFANCSKYSMAHLQRSSPPPVRIRCRDSPVPKQRRQKHGRFEVSLVGYSGGRRNFRKPERLNQKPERLNQKPDLNQKPRRENQKPSLNQKPGRLNQKPRRLNQKLKTGNSETRKRMFQKLANG